MNKTLEMNPADLMFMLIFLSQWGSGPFIFAASVASQIEEKIANRFYQRRLVWMGNSKIIDFSHIMLVGLVDNQPLSESM